jgi:parvulin-like peptidyl-prolyl isomerase
VRVDEAQPEHVLPLQGAAADARSRLRAELRTALEDRELRALYDGLRDSLKTTAYRVRYALADTATMAIAAPGPADLDRYYRGHLADYSSFDSKSGAVTAKSLDEVRDEVRTRLVSERRFEQSRALAGKVLDGWARGRVDAAVLRRVRVVDGDPVLRGQRVDGTPVGALLGDSLAARMREIGPGLARSPLGWVAFDVYREVSQYAPSFAQCRGELAARRVARLQREEEEGARRLLEASPKRFVGGPVIHYTRAFVSPPPIFDVHLTRADVERYHREHLDQFSAPELVRASDILISPRDSTPEADREARARADSLLVRLRDGEDFAGMASRVTDDPATKGNGGDLGTFGRGAMLPEVERAVFAMRPGDLSAEPVKSSVGYHILKVREYAPMVARPLVQIYPDVAEQLATERADTLARQRADSLLLTLQSAAQGRELVRRLGLESYSYPYRNGDAASYPANLRSYYDRLEGLKPGQVLRMRPKIGNLGYALTWVDSISAPTTTTWEDARPRAIEAYRTDASLRMLAAKRAELDSLLQAGWSFDSIGVLWGGLRQAKDVFPGQPVLGVGTSGGLDTLLFGEHGTDGLAPGALSDWLTLPAGILRLRMKELHAPDAGAVTTRVESERRAETERALVGYFDELKKRFPVRILDPTLRDVALPPPQGR